ncbi:MAG: C-terminal binding protein [Rhizobiales bacterium]|nr:C-terminal binding protein [Hyphomicrobiales bacterium]
MRLCLIPDAQYEDDAAVERAAAGPGVEFHVARGRSVTALDPEVRRRADMCLVWHEAPIDREALESLPSCKVIVRCGTGYDQIDIVAAGERGIPVFNVPDYGTTEVADHAIALALALLRGITTYDAALRADPVANWNWAIAPLVGRSRGRGRVFGIVGLGRIGTAAAMRAKAFDYDVVFYDPYVPDGSDIALGIRRADSLADLLAESDVVSLHTPSTAETRGMINAETLKGMKPDAVLVNTARGAIIDIAAALDAVASSRLGGLALDVIPTEPPGADDPIHRALSGRESALSGRIIVTPHAAWHSVEGQREMRERGMKTALRFLDTGSLRNCVNLEYLQGRD